MSTKSLGRTRRTARGFQYIGFVDRNGARCSLQVSSLADYMEPGISAIWIGPNEPNPQVIWHEAASVGVKTTATCGWVPVPMSDKILCNTRAHLDRKQVKLLIAHLQHWLDTGSLTLPSKKGGRR